MYKVCATDNASHGQKMVYAVDENGEWGGWKQEGYLWFYGNFEPKLFETEDEALDFAWEHGFFGASYFTEEVTA